VSFLEDIDIQHEKNGAHYSTKFRFNNLAMKIYAVYRLEIYKIVLHILSVVHSMHVDDPSGIIEGIKKEATSFFDGHTTPGQPGRPKPPTLQTPTGNFSLESFNM